MYAYMCFMNFGFVIGKYFIIHVIAEDLADATSSFISVLQGTTRSLYHLAKLVALLSTYISTVSAITISNNQHNRRDRVWHSKRMLGIY